MGLNPPLTPPIYRFQIHDFFFNYDLFASYLVDLVLLICYVFKVNYLGLHSLSGNSLLEKLYSFILEDMYYL